MSELKIKETLSLNYYGVKLLLKLDYEDEVASFVDGNDMAYRFRFNNRSIDYLGGWLKIYRALEKATILADKLLREQAKLREALVEEAWDEKAIALSVAQAKRKK